MILNHIYLAALIINWKNHDGYNNTMYNNHNILSYNARRFVLIFGNLVCVIFAIFLNIAVIKNNESDELCNLRWYTKNGYLRFCDHNRKNMSHFYHRKGSSHISNNLLQQNMIQLSSRGISMIISVFDLCGLSLFFDYIHDLLSCPYREGNKDIWQ